MIYQCEDYLIPSLLYPPLLGTVQPLCLPQLVRLHQEGVHKVQLIVKIICSTLYQEYVEQETPNYRPDHICHISHYQMAAQDLLDIDSV